MKGTEPGYVSRMIQLTGHRADLSHTDSFSAETCQILYGRCSELNVMRCPHPAVCDMLSRSDIVSVTYRCPCNLAGSGPERCLMTSEKLGIDPESETFGPKNSATYYVSIPHTGQMSLISGKNMLPQVPNNNHQKKRSEL